MKLSTMDVTPELASKWLSNNGMNRTVNHQHVARLADQMKRGGWVLNGQTISFDASGRLLDGQHRLKAIVASGCTVRMAVAIGVTDPDAFKTYDALQLKRGAHQIAQMIGVTNPVRTVAVARILKLWENSTDIQDFGRILHLGAYGKKNINPSEIAEYAASVNSEVEEALSMVSQKVYRGCGANAMVIAMVVIFNRINPVDTASFCEKLSTGANMSADDPVMHLRDRIMTREKISRGQRLDWLIAALMIKAFNAHVEGRPMKILRIRVDGDAPESFPGILGASKQ